MATLYDFSKKENSMRSNPSGVVYELTLPGKLYAPIVYLDPLQLPDRKHLRARGLMETASGVLFGALMIPVLLFANSVSEQLSAPHLPPLTAALLGLIISYLLFLPLFLWHGKNVKNEFVELGGDPTGIDWIMAGGMSPLVVSYWRYYKFITPETRAHVEATTTVKPVTSPLF